MQYKKKKNNKQRQMPYQLVYGVHSIIELLRAKRRKLVALYTTRPLPKGWERIKPYLPKKIPNIQYISRDQLTKMAASPEHMGLVALVYPFVFQQKPFTPDRFPFVLLLDGVQDVRNLGAILRSAYCTRVDGIVLCKKGSAPLTPAVFKASAGMAEHLPIYQASSLKNAIIDLKKAGYHLYMSVLDGGQDALEVEFKKPICLVIGNEEYGITPEVQKEGILVTLPQRNSEISYNASVAAGIFVFLISFVTPT